MPPCFRLKPGWQYCFAPQVQLHILLALALACVPVQSAPSAQPVAVAATVGQPDVAAVNRHYAALVHASYADTLAAALEMQQAIQAFLATPSPDALENARKTWRAAREYYGQTEAFRFYGGPVDDANGPEGRLNAWPLDEAYIDSVQGKPTAGLINNPKFNISKANLAKANERGGEENISTGWHAIEFLLWGQDQSETGPGNRSADDFVPGKAPNAERRRQYLAVVTELLIDDLKGLAKAWAPDARNYRARFEQGGQESVRKIIVGLGSLSRGELAGERLEVALNSQDQEDEHSCFSDNTHRDVVSNAQGIQNVWQGQYTRRDGSLLSGPGLRDLVAGKQPALAERASAQLAQSLKAAEAIQPPFDREIVGGKDAPGRLRVRQVIDSLVAQSRLLVESATVLGITRLALVSPDKK